MTPELFAVVGPNGSGKSSSVFETGIDKRIVFVNPDDIARTEYGHIQDENERNYLAWMSCNAQRDALLATKHTFGFETVGSHPSKVEFLEKAKSLGYVVTLLFVSTESPDINIERIRQRMERGGHGVPDEKVRLRYERTLSLLPRYFSVADIAVIWDNSLDSATGLGMRELVRKTQDGAVQVLPAAWDVEWIRRFLPRVFDRQDAL